MKGLDLSRAYYNEVIKPIIKKSLPQIADNHAAALIGWGSDVLGNDDELSRDHEWGPRCIILLSDSLADYCGILYDVLNSEIPSHFMGYPTRYVLCREAYTRVLSDTGSGNVNIDITTCSRYFQDNLDVIIPDSDIDWLSIPEHRLLELTGGEVFFDGPGELTALREFYKKYYPPDVWKYRLAYMWQSINWDIDLIGMCDARNDFLSARNCLNATLYRIMKLTFLLNRRYSPSYPKWLGKEFYKLPNLSKEICPVLESCYLDVDIKSVIGKLEKICMLLIEYQNNIDGMVKAEIKPFSLSRGFWNIDFQHIADQIYNSIEGELKSVPLYGALDQWVTNEDFLLDIQKLKRLSAVYIRGGNFRYHMNTQ